MGKEQHLCNTWLPIASFLPSKTQPSRDPAHTRHRQQLVAWLDMDLLHCRCVLQTRSGAGAGNGNLPPSIITSPLPVLLGSMAKRMVFAVVLSSPGSRTLCQLGSKRIWSTLLVGARPEHLTQPVHTAPRVSPLSQAGPTAPGSVDEGMACPLRCQNSIQKAPPQVDVVLGTGEESDTTTLAVNLSNRGLEFLVVASCLGLEVQRSRGVPLGTKNMPRWG